MQDVIGATAYVVRAIGDYEGVKRMQLTAEAFSAYFEALWGLPPFAWQRTLVERILYNGQNWPEAIALPTAAGKTACLDIAVYALASKAAQVPIGARLTAARRIFFVVDRRIIVDEAFKRGSLLVKQLQEAESGILKDVADQLRRLAQGGQPLTCYQLRGGLQRDDAWAKSPLQPTIVTSTVDQLGSRLLFRAYGRSFKAWPIEAGLTSNDSLIILDEAHASQPFLETLRAVKYYQNWATEPLGLPFQTVIMSATPPTGVSDVFRDRSLEPRTPGHPLGNRQLAAKPTRLKVVTLATEPQATEQLAIALAQAAEDLTAGRPIATVIFTNRVATARRVYKILEERYGDYTVLLTGRMRPIDRDDAAADWLDRLAAERAYTRCLDHPIFVVATQTLEVGANLDFDVLVTECASLDALRQRFGRLNRMGRPGVFPAQVLIRADQVTASDNDPVYGSAVCHTWQWLNEHSENTDDAGDREIDMGIAALDSILPSDPGLNAPAIHAPVMLPAHVDRWVQTSPQPASSPEVALFLHGPRRANADVQVCWRADLDLKATHEKWLDALTLCPPLAAECLSVPINTLRRWMTEKEGESLDGDLEGAVEERGEDASSGKPGNAHDQRPVIRWLGRDDAEVVSDARAVRPGDVLVIPAELGEVGALGDVPQRAGWVVSDWGERARVHANVAPILRLHLKVVEQWQTGEAKSRLMELCTEGPSFLEADPEGLGVMVRDTLTLLAAETPQSWLAKIAVHIAQDRHLPRNIALHPVNGLVVRGSNFSDEDDATASGTVRVSLPEHLKGVAEYARRFAEAMGLAPQIVDAVTLAARAHDLGKADPRFQALLHGENPWVDGTVLAKSDEMPKGRSAFVHVRENVGYPKGGRHELLSVRLLESQPTLLPASSSQKLRRMLVLHLVASHHGYCRPFAPVAEDRSPCTVTVPFEGQMLRANSSTVLERLDSGISDRFWCLIRHYGWWSLAWLEAIVRLADHRRSEAEQLDAAQREVVSGG